MVLLQCREVRYNPGSAEVLSGVSLAIDEGQRIGLVGVNGSGKSSLLRILAGDVAPDAGEVVRRRGLSVALVSQFLPPELRDLTLAQAVAGVATEAHFAEELMSRLGFDAAQRTQRLDTLSGGEINRVLLARAASRGPDLVLLDEPTNHLDVESVLEFQRFVTDYLHRAFVLVSHDRALLDVLTERTVFLRGGVAHSFELSYSHARGQLLAQEAAALERRRAQQKSIDRLHASMRRLAHWARVHDNEKFARKARSMGKRIERMKQAQQAAPWTDRRALGVQAGRVRATRLLDLEDLRVSTPDGRPLFSVPSLHVRRGDRVALLGENGSGKSTLLRHLRRVASAPDARAQGVRFNPQVRLGYYDQELSELDPERTLLSTLSAISDQPVDRLRGALANAGFAPRSHERKVQTLSGGEKSRLLFLVLELSSPTLLLLDEPTNHVDLEGCEALEEELLQGDTTVVFVSHDRRFTENVANRFACIRDGTLRELARLEDYFALLAPADGAEAVARASSARDASRSASAPTGEDALLARVLELEALLEADRARKPRHQKPAPQAQWQAELAALYARLD